LNVSLSVRIIEYIIECIVQKQDSDDIRQKIMNMSYRRENMGFSKATLYYMKKNTEDDKPFTLNAHVRERLEMWRTVLKLP